jgi:hypothetical protein
MLDSRESSPPVAVPDSVSVTSSRDVTELLLGVLRSIEPYEACILEAEQDGDLEVARRVCEGGAEAGAVGMLPQGQRFGWLVAPRSTVVQPSPVHTGFADDPEQAIEHLLRVMVDTPE